MSLALWAVPAVALIETFASVETAAHGLICAVRDGDTRPAPDTEVGFINIPADPVSIISPSDVVPGVLGMGFGVQFTLVGESDRLLRYVTTHPPMGARAVTVQTWHGVVGAGMVDTVFFQFDHAYEIVPGDWTLSAFDGDEMLYLARFTVVDPAQVPHLSGLCRGDIPLS